MSEIKKYIRIAFFVMGIVLTTHAQPSGPAGAPTPFGFVELLIGAGAILGGKKAYDTRREKEKQ